MRSKVLITSLPENVVLEIFAYLSIPERCQIARVCRLWNQLIRDKYLWQRVDLTARPIAPKTLWKVIRGYLSDSLLSLSLKGFLYSVKETKCLTHALLKELISRCPKLVSIQIISENLSAIDSSKFPPNLKRLFIQNCEVTQHWLKKADKSNLFETLQELSFANSKRFSSDDVQYICKLQNLKLLNLSNCYRICDDNVNQLTNALTNLETLVLSGCTITDLALHFVSHRLKFIQTLDVSDCTSLTNQGLAILGVPYCPKYLTVTGCQFLVTDLAILVKRNSEIVRVEFGVKDELKTLNRNNFQEILDSYQNQLTAQVDAV
ncbi:F-box/LRR-repeat protein 12-like [Antedon mediterranea]|uniref:F-box/LRR-repeat protein 12-like n=1 Tax=Antedon mediterranea TaxID=105859 RepID=UPI003AF663BC